MANTAAREILESLLGHLGLSFELEESDDQGRPRINIRTREPNRLIGRDGQTLDDLQYLLNRILSRNEDGVTHITVDVEGYRQREQQDFLGQIREYADRVRKTGEPFVLQPMNSFDRRLVHQEFSEDPDIATLSEEGNARLKSITLARRRRRLKSVRYFFSNPLITREIYNLLQFKIVYEQHLKFTALLHLTSSALSLQTI